MFGRLGMVVRGCNIQPNINADDKIKIKDYEKVL